MRASDSTGNQAISMATTTMEGSKISEFVDKTRNTITLVTFQGDRFGVMHRRKGTISRGHMAYFCSKWGCIEEMHMALHIYISSLYRMVKHIVREQKLGTISSKYLHRFM
jgi:hypothetical protein